mmetsp:Transcript_23200/g.50105  ORF Transcript_23200/g.50105 Transcript_23200/m.50105 type:complete len:142 (+) Transcript_23200:1529-1954(+)
MTGSFIVVHANRGAAKFSIAMISSSSDATAADADDANADADDDADDDARSKANVAAAILAVFENLEILPRGSFRLEQDVVDDIVAYIRWYSRSRVRRCRCTRVCVCMCVVFQWGESGTKRRDDDVWSQQCRGGLRWGGGTS